MTPVARRVPRTRLAATALLAALCLTVCDGGGGDARLTVVAAMYPLAWAAGQVGGPGVEVIDLTPPGAEAHDATLTARQRAQIADADAVLLLGMDGFQPEIEAAARERDRYTFEVWGIGRPPQGVPSSDPHVWLDLAHLPAFVEDVVEALAIVDPPREDDYRARAAELAAQIDALHVRARTALASCRHDTLIATHEAFGYLTARYGLEQVGLTGLSPEAEPSANRLRAAGEAVRTDRAGAVFFEATEEGERLGRRVAEDLGVPALPLSTLESRPPEGDFLSVMASNLDSLEEGLACR